MKLTQKQIGGEMDKVDELVEWVAQELSKGYKHNWTIEDYRKRAEQILSHTDLALIDPMCSTTLKWVREDAKTDGSCDYWDCTRGIKKGEHYYFEDYGSGQGHSYCIDCTAFFMAQKLSHVIPLAEALEEKWKSS